MYLPHPLPIFVKLKQHKILNKQNLFNEKKKERETQKLFRKYCFITKWQMDFQFPLI